MINDNYSPPAKKINQATKLPVDIYVSSDLNAKDSSCDSKNMNSGSSQASVSVESLISTNKSKTDNCDIGNSKLGHDHHKSSER